jgi:hypothetical protein
VILGTSQVFVFGIHKPEIVFGISEFDDVSCRWEWISSKKGAQGLFQIVLFPFEIW